MTLNGIIALILRYFTEFDNFAGRLRHSSWRQTYDVRKISSSSYIWPKLAHVAVARSICELRQLSVLSPCAANAPDFTSFHLPEINVFVQLTNQRHKCIKCNYLFTALHVMQMRSSDENSVCSSVRLSVCLSVCHTRELWQNGKKICPDLYTIRKNIYPSFLRRRMVGGGRPLLPEILG